MLVPFDASAVPLCVTVARIGEHYVVDLTAGLALAAAVQAAEPLLRPAGRRLDRLWRSLEPR